MSSELSILALYGLLIVVVVLLNVLTAMSQVGLMTLGGARDDMPALTGVAGRVERALTNSVVAMALSMSGTFFWLWRAQATPLALGMGFSWAGTAGVLGWWWLFRLLDRPEAMREHAGLFVFVAAYFVGALLHFRVVGASLGRRALSLPPAGGTRRA